MSQFASIKKRRVHTFGHGLRAIYPEPPEWELMCEAGNFIDTPPIRDPMKQAALLSRFLRFGPTYGAIDGRFGGPLAWRVQPTPYRYLNGPVDDVLCRLFQAYFDAEPDSAFLNGYQPGQKIEQPGIEPHELKVLSLVPLVNRDDVLDQLWGKCTTSGDYIVNNNGGFTQWELDTPAAKATMLGNDGETYYKTFPARSLVYETGGYRTDGRGNLLLCAINLILWGHSQAPEGPGSLTTCYLYNAAGFASDLWLQYIERFAGRVLWQMVHTETLTMIEDLNNRSTGGRGGLTQEESQMFTAKLSPANYNPYLSADQWSKIAPVADPLILRLAIGAVEALISLL